MRLIVSTISTLGLAALLTACGGGQKEDTTPASTEAVPAEGEAAPAEGEAPAEDEGLEPPAEEGAAGAEEEPAGGGGW